MKSLLVVLMALVAGVAAQAEEVASIKNISVRVRELTTKKADKDHWRTDYGSYDTTTTRQKRIEVEVLRMSPKPAPDVTVRIAWVGRGNVSKEYFVYHIDKQQIDLANKKFETLVFTSPETQERNTNYAALGQRYTEGFKATGYAIVVNYQGDRIHPYFSSGIQAISSPEKWNKALDLFLEGQKD